MPFPQAASPSAWSAWRRRLRAALRKSLAIDLLGRPPVPRPRIRRTLDQGSYLRHQIEYQTLPGNLVRAFLLVPKAGPARLPAVICPHGHVPGGSEGVVDPGQSLGAAYGHELAQAGAVVLAPDNAGNAARHDGRPLKDGCESLWRRLNHVGLDLTGFRIWELMAGLNLLQAHPRVDPRRLGAAGLSGGCWLSQVLSALDTRVRAAVLSGYFSTFRQTAWVGHCICHHPKGIGAVCEMHDIAALIAPRPLMIESGTHDLPYPVEPAFSHTRRAYRLVGAPGNLFLHRYDGGHLFHGTRSLPWLMRQLTG